MRIYSINNDGEISYWSCSTKCHFFNEMSFFNEMTFFNEITFFNELTFFNEMAFFNEKNFWKEMTQDARKWFVWSFEGNIIK